MSASKPYAETQRIRSSLADQFDQPGCGVWGLWVGLFKGNRPWSKFPYFDQGRRGEPHSQ